MIVKHPVSYAHTNTQHKVEMKSNEGIGITIKLDLRNGN